METGITMKYFGSSGIRGIVNEKITPELAMKVGMAVGKQYDTVIIGRDPRPTGQMVESAVISGLTSQGSEVYRAGMIPTPTLAKAASNFECGVVITASHNPAQYNGIKLWNPDGSSFNTEQMESTERHIDSFVKLPSWDKVGRVYEYPGAVEEHMEKILELFGTDHEAKVVIDCANGAGCAVTPFLLREMGCDVVSMNSNPDGSFPAHDPEPKEDNLLDLKKMVKNTNADLGLAHDGDADRLVAFDRNGKYLGGDELLALFASQFTDKILVPVNSSMILEEIVDEVVRTKVGDVFVAEELKKQKASFGGEPSGTWIFPKMSYAPDAVYAAALLVDMSEKMDISKKIDELPSYPRKKVAFQVENKSEVMSTLKEIYKQYHDPSVLNFVDGIRVDYENGWALTRASGTEPKIRITVEAKDSNTLEEIFDRTRSRLKEAMR